MLALTLFLQRNIPRYLFERLAAHSDGFGVGRDLIDGELPIDAQNVGQYYDRVVDLLEQHGLLDRPDLYLVLADARPNRAAELLDLATRRGVDPGALALLSRPLGRVSRFLRVASPSSLLTRITAGLLSFDLVLACADLALGVRGPSVCEATLSGSNEPEARAIADLRIIPDNVVGKYDPPSVAVPREAGRVGVSERSRAGKRPRQPSSAAALPGHLPPPLPAETMALFEHGDRCTVDVQRSLTADVPKFARQRDLLGDSTPNIRLLLDVTADGLVAAVSSDKAWGDLNQGVVKSVERMVINTAKASRQRCVCTIDFTKQRATCKEHT